MRELENASCGVRIPLCAQVTDGASQGDVARLHQTVLVVDVVIQALAQGRVALLLRQPAFQRVKPVQVAGHAARGMAGAGTAAGHGRVSLNFMVAFATLTVNGDVLMSCR